MKKIIAKIMRGMKWLCGYISYLPTYYKRYKAAQADYDKIDAQYGISELWNAGEREAATDLFASILNGLITLPEPWVIDYSPVPENNNAGKRAVMGTYPSRLTIYVDLDKVKDSKAMMIGLRHEWQHIVQYYQILGLVKNAQLADVIFGLAGSKSIYYFNELEIDACMASVSGYGNPLFDITETVDRCVTKIIKLANRQ